MSMTPLDPYKTKDMMTVGQLKAILNNLPDGMPIAVSVDNKSKPRDIVRTGHLITSRHKNPDILSATIGLFLWKDEEYY